MTLMLQKIVLNETAVTNAGHSLSSLNCCYRGIVRQKQLSYMFGSRNADRQVEYEFSKLFHRFVIHFSN